MMFDERTQPRRSQEGHETKPPATGPPKVVDDQDILAIGFGLPGQAPEPDHLRGGDDDFAGSNTSQPPDSRSPRESRK